MTSKAADEMSKDIIETEEFDRSDVIELAEAYRRLFKKHTLLVKRSSVIKARLDTVLKAALPSGWKAKMIHPETEEDSDD